MDETFPAAGRPAGSQGARSIRTSTGYLMVLRQGDDVFAELEALAMREGIPSASFVGMGFLSEVTFGFYDFARKAFDPKSFGQVELMNMTGTIAWQNGKPSIHAHGAAAGADFAAVGGHLLGLKVGTGSLEITVIVHPARLERIVEPVIQANILQL
jgi:predicted DNA-binding protein with PD1-like motif